MPENPSYEVASRLERRLRRCVREFYEDEVGREGGEPLVTTNVTDLKDGETSRVEIDTHIRVHGLARKSVNLIAFVNRGGIYGD